MQRYRADMHIHSCYSFDSRMKLREITDTLEQKGIQYAGICDHIELTHDQLKEVLHTLKVRNREIDSLKHKTNVELLKGIEVSEPHIHADDMFQIVEHNDIDFILGSIHHILGMSIRKMQHHQNISMLYLRSLLAMVEKADIDAIAHLDYLKRYITDPTFNQKMLKEILNIIIERDIALEVNTSGYRRCGEYFPSSDILELYANLGGKKVTIGSDAHKAAELYDSIDDALTQIKAYNLEPGIIKKRSFKPF